ncbi:MAG: GNAT family N-acetyltransferase [Gammaproteobacteria bacterium]|jgi:GNAT superfamily N-acetyltransferase
MRDVETRTVAGEALRRHVDDLARLRISVFREFPYLYDGTEAYERRYLNTYIASSEAMAVLVFDGDRVVGASTGIPLANESEEFKQPFIEQGIDPRRVFYCGESVLLPAYRGQGIYKAFFTTRETVAARGGFDVIGFCGVVRAPDHHLRPPDYAPLDPVWRHFGYAAHPELVAHFDWKDIDCDEETSHPMMFWLKNLTGSAP